MQDRFKFRFFETYNNTMLDCDDYDIDELLEEGKPVMQCTGLKDKNGKLIYEGDVVRLKAKNGMTFDYAVKFKNYCFILEYINGKLKGTKARDFAKQYAQPQKMYEHGYMVIGNIYENPKLLED